MLDEIARRLQFNYSIRIARDAAYGKEDESGQWSGIIGELTRRVNSFERKGLYFEESQSLDSRFRYWSFNDNLSERTGY